MTEYFYFVKNSIFKLTERGIVMKSKRARMLLSLMLTFGLVSGVNVSAAEPTAPAVQQTLEQVTDPVLGVTLEYSSAWRVHHDPVLLDTYGFLLADTANEEAIARFALEYGANPSDLESLVQAKIAQNPDVEITRSEIEIGQGIKGIALSNVPGSAPHTLVYLTANGHVYQIRLYEESLSEQSKQLLASVRFAPPTKTVQSLGLVEAAKDVEQRRPEQAPKIDQKRQAANAAAIAAEKKSGRQITGGPGAIDTGDYCGAYQDDWLYWQIQWDETANFYYGYPGWSQMSGNGGSWWGENYHVGICYSDYANSYYAIDYPLQTGAYVYAAFAGTVTFAGWGYDGWETLGMHVDVRSSQDSSVYNINAHLSEIWVSPGQYVSAGTIIGLAGATGGPWDPHLHTKVDQAPYFHYSGQLYGGHSMRPTGVRCYNCDSNYYDYAATDGYGGGYYTSFWRNRWVMW